MHLLKEGELLRVVGPVGHNVLQDVRQATVVQVNQALQSYRFSVQIINQLAFKKIHSIILLQRKKFLLV
jgi:hypothetical protein